MQLITQYSDHLNSLPISTNEKRRGHLLAILLAGIGLLVLVTVIVSLINDNIFNISNRTESLLSYVTMISVFVSILGLLWINRLGYVNHTGILLVCILTFGILFGIKPSWLIWGPPIFYLTIPILIASFVIRPAASFGVVAATVAGFIFHVSRTDAFGFNFIGAAGLLGVAFVSWLSASSLDKALKDLFAINQELDQRVEERTKQLSEALEREQQEAWKNEAILESIADGVLVFDEDLKTIAANPSIKSLLGRSPTRMINRDIRDLMDSQISSETSQLILTQIQNVKDQPANFKIDWEEKTLAISLAPIKANGSSSGALSGTVAVIRDFTREAAIDRMKSDFISIASHELRTPLTALKGYIELLMITGQDSLTLKQQDYLETMENNAERLQYLIEDLLNSSQLESGQLELQCYYISLVEITHAVIHELSEEIAKRHLEVHIDMPANLPLVFADRERVIQILINLVSNAYKYTNEGSITIQSEVENGFVKIGIHDTGYGIPIKEQEKIFSRFFRSSDRQVRRQPGTGLGLNITHSLVELHGGKIWFESEVGKGSSFYFTLPIKQPESVEFEQVAIPA